MSYATYSESEWKSYFASHAARRNEAVAKGDAVEVFALMCALETKCLDLWSMLKESKAQAQTEISRYRAAAKEAGTTAAAKAAAVEESRKKAAALAMTKGDKAIADKAAVDTAVAVADAAIAKSGAAAVAAVNAFNAMVAARSTIAAPIAVPAPVAVPAPAPATTTATKKVGCPCPICTVTPAKNPVTAKCGHVFCEGCMLKVRAPKICPLCRVVGDWHRVYL